MYCLPTVVPTQCSYYPRLQIYEWLYKRLIAVFKTVALNSLAHTHAETVRLCYRGVRLLHFENFAFIKRKFEIWNLQFWGAFDSAINHKHQRRKHQSVTAKREKSQTPKFVQVRLVLRLRPLAFATFLVWRLRIGACGVDACRFWRLWQLPLNSKINWINTP